MSEALDYIRSAKLEGGVEYEDMLGDVIFSGRGLSTTAERKSVQNVVGKALELMTVEALGFTHLNVEGADIVSHEHKVIAELKNRHNTLNHGGRQRLIRVMKNLTLNEYVGYDKYIVVFHPKAPGLQRNIGQAITEISAMKFFHKFGVDFSEVYLDLVKEVAESFGVEVPETTPYYRDVVFKLRKTYKKKKV